MQQQHFVISNAVASRPAIMAENSNPPGSMQSWPLLVTHALEYAARWHKDQEIVCKTVEGPVTISTYAGTTMVANQCTSCSARSAPLLGSPMLPALAAPPAPPRQLKHTQTNCFAEANTAASLGKLLLLVPPADLNQRAKLCALALQKLGVKPGDVVGTLAWNTTRLAAHLHPGLCLYVCV